MISVSALILNLPQPPKNAVIPVPKSRANFPIRLAKFLGLLKIAVYQTLPAILEIIKS
jgi:hypothetical protein